MNEIDLKKELEYDYNKYLTFCINIHRRLTFENSEEYFYVTTDSINRDDYKFGNDYLLSYWGNDARRVEALLKFEIGDESPANGELICYGDFIPKGDDLKNVRYRCIHGRYEFKSAKNALKYNKKVNNLDHLMHEEEKIDINKFFRLKFNLADIGEQSRALYDDYNAIIDGSAGTGKSTIALQKLKYLSVNKHISQEEILIVVKNSHLKMDFQSLLLDKNLKLGNIGIKTIHELNPNIEIYTREFLTECQQKSFNLRKVLESFILKRNAISIYRHYNSLFLFLVNKKLLDRDKKYSLEIIKELKDEYSNSLYKDYFLAFEYLHRYKNYYDDIYRNKEQKLNIEEKLKKLEDKLNHKKDLTDREYQIYEKLEIELNKLNKKEFKSYRTTIEQEKILRTILKQLYFKKDYIDIYYLMEFSSYEKFLILKYLNLEEYEYDTILIDEAQDYSLVELEILRLYAKRVILTGDILQNLDEDDSQIKDWSDILNVDKIFGIEDKNGVEKLNIFTLKHNFRQTYQLANASYNFRQLLLNKKIEDIEQDYFLSEKELNGKPYELVKIVFNQDIKQYIKDKIEHIKNRFTSQIPIVLIYKTEEEKKQYQNELSSFRLSYDTEQTKSIDVILVDILEAKGKQFPVVVSHIDELTDREIYLIMTRGQFEVEFLSSQKDIENDFLEILYINEWIETKEINFVKNKLNTKKDLNQNLDNGKGQLVKERNNGNKIDELTLKNKKDEFQKENIPKLKEQIPKHQAKTTQYDEKINPDIITDEEQYQKKFIQKVQEDIKEFEEDKQNEIVQEIVVVRKKSNTKKSKEQRQKIKDYLFDTYKGYCQICGFTFRKVEDGKNSFEMFNWNDKRVVKKKKSFITTADSFCLCRNCSANIKWGAFEPIFMDKIMLLRIFLIKV